MPGVLIKQAVAVGIVAISASLTGCGSDPERTAASTTPKTTSAAPAPSSSSATPSPRPTGLPRAKDGKRLGACRDANCEVLVSSGQTITLNDKFRVPPVHVTVQDDSVTFQSIGADGFQSTFEGQTPDQGGPSTINGVSFQVVAVRGKKAVIKIAH
jgi:hypothetical protein